MTNYEKNKEIIDEIWEADSSVAVVDGKVKSCDETKCMDCDFFENKEKCSVQTVKWLVSEYKEPAVDWSKVKVDTPILARNDIYDKWQRRYFAKYENNKVYVWYCGRTSWSAESENDVVWCKYAKLAEEEECFYAK